jgi:hypothetical protein
MTIVIICENSDIINSYGKSGFYYGKTYKTQRSSGKYGVVGETKQEAEFSPTTYIVQKA